MAAGQMDVAKMEGAMSVITTIEQLEALYGLPGETSLVKQFDHVIPE